jgi:hypothetical protein
MKSEEKKDKKYSIERKILEDGIKKKLIGIVIKPEPIGQH